MVNAQDLEEQRLRFGLEAETVARGIQPNVMNNQPRAVDENIVVDGVIPPHCQPIAPMGTMASRRKNVTKPSPLTTSQSEGHDESESTLSESERSSQENATTSPPVVNTEDETGEKEEVDATYKDIEITTNDTMVMYVNMHEPDPAARQQLLDCYRSMWTVNRSEEFFNNGIVNKTGGFKNRAIMPETRMVVADIKVFPDIYRIFQLHQFD
uniref:Integrase core domain containing protein n=1 Tax=Solanum tuberosum TaxID=4113 RepID=M1DR74_SOLTU